MKIKCFVDGILDREFINTTGVFYFSDVNYNKLIAKIEIENNKVSEINYSPAIVFTTADKELRIYYVNLTVVYVTNILGILIPRPQFCSVDRRVFKSYNFVQGFDSINIENLSSYYEFTGVVYNDNLFLSAGANYGASFSTSHFGANFEGYLADGFYAFGRVLDPFDFRAADIKPIDFDTTLNITASPN